MMNIPFDMLLDLVYKYILKILKSVLIRDIGL